LAPAHRGHEAAQERVIQGLFALIVDRENWDAIVGEWRILDFDMNSGKRIDGITFKGPAIAAVLW
jgi:hypothetical protein